MQAGENKTRYIRMAAMVALAGNALLALLKIVTGMLAQSGALVGDGMDSSADVLISVITLVVVKIISKPADAQHPWGHKRAETVATVFLSFMIFFAGAQLMVSSVSKIIANAPGPEPSFAAVFVTLVSIAGKLLLAYSQHQLGKRADSAMLRANAKNMAGDVFISVGVLAGFGISSLTKWAHADAVAALLIGLWMIKTAVSIFLDANLELMDGNSDVESYRVLVAAVNAVEGASNPHRARMRCIAGFWDIDLDIHVHPESTVTQAHHIATQVEQEIKRRLENVFDIVIHVEPTGDRDAEVFGLSEDEMTTGERQDPGRKAENLP